ncbi:MAG: M20/M25/M40 family metallo-hydrolase, partial [Ignavibacteriales bacterium]|nr:M20/M25/M40 family metallo-hydrolase [Ignavibacteriales bacterium]
SYVLLRLTQRHRQLSSAPKTYKDLFAKEPSVDKWTFSTNGIMTCGVYGILTIGFGPGNEVLAHAPDEKVPVSDLVAAAAFYAAFAYEIGMLKDKR